MSNSRSSWLSPASPPDFDPLAPRPYGSTPGRMAELPPNVIRVLPGQQPPPEPPKPPAPAPLTQEERRARIHTAHQALEAARKGFE